MSDRINDFLDKICASVKYRTMHSEIREEFKNHIDEAVFEFEKFSRGHEAPNAEVTVVEGEKDAVQSKIKELLEQTEGKVTGVLTMYGAVYDKAVMLSAGSTNKEYAKNLFAALREFDELGVEVVFAEFSEKDGYGLAVKNRLNKAAAQRVIHV